MIKKSSYTTFYYLLIIVTGIVTFANVLANDFVWLDKQYIVTPALAHSMNVVQLMRGSALTGAGFYRPFTAIYYATVNTLFHNQALYFHLIQISIHICNSLIVFSLFKKLFSRHIACFAALIFLVHPLNESTASFISNSADAIYMFFGLIAMKIYIDSSTRYKYLLIAILLLGSLLTKESGVLFLFMIVSYMVLYAKNEWRHTFVAVGISMIMYVCIRFFMQGFQFYQIDLYPIMRLSLFERMINIPAILFYYSKSLFVPVSLGINRRFTITTVTLHEFYMPMLIDMFCISVMLIGGYYLKKINAKSFTLYSWFGCSFFLSFLTLIQIFPLDYTVAARWFYFPMFALLGMVGAFFHALHIKKQMSRYIAAVGIVVIVLLVSLTMKKNTYWRNDIALFTRAAQIEDNFITEGWLANAYLEKGDLQHALVHIHQSITLFPYDNNLAVAGQIYEKLHNERLAEDYYQKAVLADNYAPYTHDEHTFQLIIQHYLRINQQLNARRLLSVAKREYPQNSYFLTLSAMIDYNNQQKLKAIGEIQRAYAINPQEPIIKVVYERILQNLPLEFAID